MAAPNDSQHDDDVEQLLLNARLRDELEPYLDESVEAVDVRRMPTQQENEFLRSMLEWERAPVLPISRWFDPELKLPPPDAVPESELHKLLWDTIHILYSKRIALDFTDHLSDHKLYCMIYRDILPSLEKNIERTNTYLHWHCLDAGDNPDTWLRFYASDAERQGWAEESGEALPPKEPPPYRRNMPRRPH